MKQELEKVFESVLSSWDSELIEFNCFESILKQVYFKKRVFWTGSYFVSSCGGVTIDVLKKYVQNQDSPPPKP